MCVCVAVKDAITQQVETDLLLSRGLLTRQLHFAKRAMVDEERRAVSVIASTGAIDGHGEIVEQNFRFERFAQNPAYLWNHNSWGQDSTELLGHAEEFRVDGSGANAALKMDLIHATADINPQAERVFLSFKAEHQRAVSIGFRPHTVWLELDDDNEVFHLDDNELYEVSAVPIGSNPEALGERSMFARRAFLLERALQCGHERNKPLERHINKALERAQLGVERLTVRAVERTPLVHDVRAKPTTDTPSTPPERGEENTVSEKEKLLQEQLTKALAEKATAEQEAKSAASEKEAFAAKLTAETEKSARLTGELEAAKAESMQRKELLDQAEKRAEEAVKERDELFAASVERQLKDNEKRMMPDEAETLRKLAASNKDLYAEQMARIEKRSELALFRDNIVPDEQKGNKPPQTGGEGERTKGADADVPDAVSYLNKPKAQQVVIGTVPN